MPIFVKTSKLTPNSSILNQRLKDLTARQNVVMSSVLNSIQVDMTPQDIADVARDSAKTNGVEFSFRKFQNYPDDLSVGLRHHVMNAVPNKDYRVKVGEIVRVGLGTHDSGSAFATQNWSVIIGQPQPSDEQVLHGARACLREVLPMLRAGIKYSEIADRLKIVSAQKNLFLNQSFVGHPIGERPIVQPHLVPPKGFIGNDYILSEGVVLSLFVLGHHSAPKLELCDDGWTVRDKKHLASACFSQMVLITDSEPQVLTADYSK